MIHFIYSPYTLILKVIIGNLMFWPILFTFTLSGWWGIGVFIGTFASLYLARCILRFVRFYKKFAGIAETDLVIAL